MLEQGIWVLTAFFDYLQGNPLWLQAVKYPLASLGYETKYDVIVRAEGGGLSAQAQAILLGVARALIVANQANRDPLKKKSCWHETGVL
jgi:small subunit ribosomal protein S9